MRRIRQSGLALFLLLAIAPLCVFADQLMLMSGKKVEGKVVEQKDDYVIIEVKGINIMYRRFEIKDVMTGSSDYKISHEEYVQTDDELSRSSKVRPEEELVKSVNDPKTQAALMKFDAAMADIGKDCQAPAPGKDTDFSEFMNKASQCICKHLAEVVKINQIKVDAFIDLMRRRPEFVNEMVHIEGTTGNWVLRPEDVSKNNIEELSKAYNCK